MIIAQEGYQDIEYGEPKEVFESAGFEVITASKTQGLAKGSLGGTTEAEIALGEVETKDFDAIVFIGGPGAVVYQHDEEAHRIVSEALEEEKILAAICIAPTILAYAGGLKDKKATVWNGDGEQSKILEAQGAEYAAESVVVEGRTVTADGPSSAKDFARNIINLLS